MSRTKYAIVPIPESQVLELIDNCLKKKNMSRQALAAAVGLRYPKKGQEPVPLSPQTIANQLSPGSPDLTIDTLAKWCSVLDYPLDDLLAGNEYVDPQSLEALRREFRRALRRIEELEIRLVQRQERGQ